eukprot:g35710.t1
MPFAFKVPLCLSGVCKSAIMGDGSDGLTVLSFFTAFGLKALFCQLKKISRNETEIAVHSFGGAKPKNRRDKMALETLAAFPVGDYAANWLPSAMVPLTGIVGPAVAMTVLFNYIEADGSD